MAWLFDFFLNQRRLTAIWVAALLAVAIAAADWVIVPNVSIGLLYLFPILIAAPHMDRPSIVTFALLCDALREQFGPGRWDADLVPRFATAFIAYAGVGLLALEVAQHRRETQARIRQLSEQMRLRESAEAQVQGLIEANPAALFSIDPRGKVVLANAAARELFQSTEEPLEGKSIDNYLPTLAQFLKPSGIRHLVRTMVECTGRRKSGEAFLAHVWVSSPGPPAVTGITALVFDASEQLRSREESGFHSLALSARVMLGEYWHEIRGLASAMRMVTTRLMRMPAVADTEEITALNSLVQTLEKAASVGLNPTEEEPFDIASLRVVLEQFRIIINPWFEEAEAVFRWEDADDLPLVRGNHQMLLQVFLNLARNALRALEDTSMKEFAVTAAVERDRAVVRFRNTGRQVIEPAQLFQPFQPGAAGSGLGLHVSRAIVRSFGGDLRYEPVPDGACFTVLLEPRKISDIFPEGNA